MKISAEITLMPLKDDYIPVIKEFIKSLRGLNLEILENPLSTQVYGEYDVLMNILISKIKNVFSQENSIMINLKIVKGDRSKYEPDF
ncbi:MAG: hypothetical protein CMD32_06980 [Flavobacteriales bacterium]|jgi:uncharacterized protein YqgV (UPF0045/DUF77 family)|nr:hypothetical protein [Flavobacteriales bacterium]|tara:strand:+ start:137 stop:397 length:261 start_codon:yes stop_codon:yes gene_type:complete